jgi:hypothetical protein
LNLAHTRARALQVAHGVLSQHIATSTSTATSCPTQIDSCKVLADNPIELPGRHGLHDNRIDNQVTRGSAWIEPEDLVGVVVLSGGVRYARVWSTLKLLYARSGGLESRWDVDKLTGSHLGLVLRCDVEQQPVEGFASTHFQFYGLSGSDWTHLDSTEQEVRNVGARKTMRDKQYLYSVGEMSATLVIGPSPLLSVVHPGAPPGLPEASDKTLRRTRADFINLNSIVFFRSFAF